MDHRKRVLRTLLVAFMAAAPVTSAWAQPAEPAEQAEQADAPESAEEEGEEEGEEQGEEGEQPAEGQRAEAARPTQMPEEDAGRLPGASLSAPEDASPEFREALDGFRDAFGHYAAEIEDYQSTVDSIVDAEYARRQAKINALYDAKIRTNEAVERDYRLDAIATFENFLERYPDQARYTPDALFRLAELYFEKANDDFLLADEEYQNQIALYEAGRIPDPPGEPIRDYGQTIVTFERLIEDWPDYRLLDGAYYLLAYTQQQMGNERLARDLFAELIVNRPDSEFVPEAWIRIGEYHFDVNELELAQQAYLEAMKYEDSKFFDKALYKLAWTYYRQDDFDSAIKQFSRLVEYSDEMERRTGQSGSVLRAEAVQYIAISLAEEDWDLDGQKDDDFGLVRVKRYIGGDKPYQREVLAQLGEYLFDNTRYQDAVDVYRFVLEKYPLDRKNPELHEKIVVALIRDDNLDAAFTERGRLSEYYGKGSDWYAYQQKVGNAEALRYAEGLVRDNLLQSATWYHQEAQQLRNEAQVRDDEEIMARARAKYADAAKGYEQFLEKYPNDKDNYQWNFYFAETLYYSGQYEPAYEQYQVVREMDVKKNDYQETSAFNAIKALEYLIAAKAERGELPARFASGGGMEEARETAKSQETAREDVDERGEQKTTVKAEAMPEELRRYVTAMDRYVVLGLENGEDAHLDGKLAFQAAKIYYDLGHFDTARKRFAWIVDEYPDNEVAYLSGSLILETYRRENDYDNLARWADRLGNVLEGEQAEAVKAEVREFKLGAMFKSAEQLFAQEKYEEAAAEYVRLLQEDPETKYAAKALNNAAVAYENVQRYESAMKLYERVYKEHPRDPLAAYALYRVGVNQERFFDFDNAIQSYELFYDTYRDKPQSDFDGAGLEFNLTEKRGDALRSAAVLLENLQRYPEAARTYEQYAEAYPDNDQAPEALWQAALVWKKAGQPKKMIAAIEDFNETYGGARKYDERALEGMMLIADHYEKRGDDRTAARWYQRILDAYQARGIQPGSEAAYHAAKAQFMLAEDQFAEWAKLQIKGGLNRQKKLLEQKIAGQKELTKEFEKVFEYGSLEWTLASGFRVGSLFQQFAQSLYEVPIPFEEGSEEWEIYRTQLEDIAIPLEDQAIERYEKTIAKAREAKIVNEWTAKTLEELNKYKPADYPLYKEERQVVEYRSLTGQSLMNASDYQAATKPPSATEAK